MIPRLSSRSTRTDGRGQSFKGLSAYLFNEGLDKPDPARAPWAETLNCHCSDPSQAWHEMAWTHQHANELKAAAGAARGGRRNEFPVWHVSLRAHGTKEAATAALIGQWATELDPKKTPALILAATRKDVAQINSEARAAMRAAGRLGPDVVVGAREETMGEPVRDFRLRIAPGERLLFTKNDKGMGVRNGTLGTLENAEGGVLTVRLDGPERRRVRVDLTAYRNLAHGYALTVHKAQGVTVDRVHVLASRAMDRHSTYVALSRHREAVTLHYSQAEARDLDALAKRIGRDRPKGTTLDHWGHPQRERTEGRIVVARTLSETLSRVAHQADAEKHRRTHGFSRVQRPTRDYGWER